MCQELSQLKETCAQFEEVQKENLQLGTLNAESKVQIDSLTEVCAVFKVFICEIRMINAITIALRCTIFLQLCLPGGPTELRFCKMGLFEYFL